MPGANVLSTCVCKESIAPVFPFPECIEDEMDSLVMAGGSHVTEDAMGTSAPGVDRGVFVFATEKTQRGRGETHLVESCLTTVSPVAELDCELECTAGDEASRSKKRR